MEELIKRLERVIQTGVPDKDGMHPISAETMLEAVKAQLSTNLASLGTDCISRHVYEQCAWERNIAIEQLTELGYGLGEKIRTEKDCISRQAAIDALDQIFDRCEEIEAHLPEGDPDRTGYKMYPDYMTVWKYLHQLPSAQPEIVRCKDCKYAEYIDDVQTLWCTECGQGRTVAPNDFCSYAERREVTT